MSILQTLVPLPSKVIFPPNQEKLYEADTQVTVFLAGSIEMGKAEDWQTKVTADVSACKDLRYLFNPRRVDFYADAVQSITDEYFKGQVEWELNHIDSCDILFMYLDPNTKSPISLMELGYIASSRKAIVCCPEGFWRKGNVEVMCARENVPLYTNLDEAIQRLILEISRKSDDKKRQYEAAAAKAASN